MRFYFPIHLDGGNRGCEGIAKGTAVILGVDKTKMIGLCNNPTLDCMLGIDKYVTLYPPRKSTWTDQLMFHVYPRIWSHERVLRHSYSYKYDSFLNNITTNDIMISTGGDMLCYSNNQVIYTNNYLHNRGVKTVLWGCSMGCENLTSEKEETLHNFQMIYARESLSFDFFKNLGLGNVVCYPDPAFVLDPESTVLPEIFKEGDVIGLNISKYVLGENTEKSMFAKQVDHFIQYILNDTKMNILLVPHVTWENQDDRLTANIIKNKYLYNNRVSVLNIDYMNYNQIRYIISNCRFFIGARTHAVISAYSTCIPSIALGYSIKSRGIAHDLGLSEKLIINCKTSLSGTELMDSYQYLYENENEIKNHLNTIIPEYRKKPLQVKNILQNIV